MKNTGQSSGVALILKHKLAFFIAFFLVFTVTYGFLAIIDFLPEAPSEELSTDSNGAPANLNDGEEVETTNIETVVIDGRVEEEVADDLNETSSTDPDETTVEESSLVVETQSETVEDLRPESALSPELSLGTPVVLPQSMTINGLNRNLTVLNPTSRNINDLDAALLKGVVRHPDSAKLNQNGTVFILGHSSYLPNVINRNFQAFNGIQKLEWGDTISLFADGVEYVYRVDRVYEAPASEVVVPIAGPIPKLTLATCDSFGSKDDRFVVEATQIEVKNG